MMKKHGNEDKHLVNTTYSKTSFSSIKGNVQFVQKVTLEPLMDFKQNHYGSWKYYKSCYF